MNNNAAIIPGVTGKLETLSDGTVKVVMYFNIGNADKALNMFGKHGTDVAVAQLNESVGIQLNQPNYGDYANKLRQSSFFRAPEVWKLIGTDNEFREYIKKQGSCLSGDFEYYDDDTGDGLNVAHHVLRSDATPARQGPNPNKPAYFCVALTDTEHKYLHQHGERMAFKRFAGLDLTVDQAKTKFDKLRLDSVIVWGWQSLREQLGHTSWSLVPPKKLFDWAEQHNVMKYLPVEYKDAA